MAAWNDKGVALIRLGKYDEGLNCYNKALEINPEYTRALNNKVLAWNSKGVALGKMEKHEEKLKCYNKALEINPNYALSLLNKATALNNIFQRYEEAIDCYNRILKLDENSIKEGIKGSRHKYPDVLVVVWNDKGTAFFRLKNYKESIDCYIKALEINPNFEMALNNKKNAENALIELKNIICPQCGYENPQESEYCINCGRQLKIKKDSKKCSNCGFENLEVAEFCIECGKKFISTENNYFCPKCNTQINSETKFCPECGNKIEQINNNKIYPKCNSTIDKDVKFCPECGENQSSSSNTALIPTENKALPNYAKKALDTDEYKKYYININSILVNHVEIVESMVKLVESSPSNTSDDIILKNLKKEENDVKKIISQLKSIESTVNFLRYT